MSRGGGKDKNKTQDSLTRIAIVNSDRCKPKRCRQECKKSCPVVRMGMKLSVSILSFTFNVKYRLFESY